jgi:hypothetical protein
MMITMLGVAQPVGATPDSAPDEVREDQFGQDVNRPTFDAPTMALNKYEFALNEVVTVTVAGFTSRIVTISVCGNKALRGSSDCNTLESEGLGLDGDGRAKLARLPAVAPPAPCPCVIRVTSNSNSEVAVADVTLVGHPVAELVEPAGFDSSLVVTMSAEPASNGALGWARSSLGGSTDYDVTVVIRNESDRVVDGVTLTGAVGRSAEDVIASLRFGSPGLIGAGQTWQETVRVDLPAPVFGDAQWNLDVAAAGFTISASDNTSHVPGLLLVAIPLLAVDIVFLLVRRRRRRSHRGQADGVWAPASHDAPDSQALVPLSM